MEAEPDSLTLTSSFSTTAETPRVGMSTRTSFTCVAETMKRMEMVRRTRCMEGKAKTVSMETIKVIAWKVDQDLTARR